MKQVSELGTKQHPTIAVVIPYWQRNPGVLRPALEAALSQEGLMSSCKIIIVDDGSPWPVSEELKELSPAHLERLTIITQPSSGPGAARNAGLDNVPDDTEFVAFLDSDDVWSSGHLENAIYALQLGYDFYFADFYFPDYKEKTAFVRAGKMNVGQHELLDEHRGLYAYKGDMMDQILVTGNVIGTSTVVYRYSKYKALRFRTQFFNGQDYTFWLDFSRLSNRFVFSIHTECDYGVGVNIYSGAGWGSDRSLDRLKNELFLWKSVEKIFSLTNTQQKHNKQRIERLREAIVRDLIYRLHHAIRLPKGVIGSIVRCDPLLIIKLFTISARIVLTKLMGREFSA